MRRPSKLKTKVRGRGAWRKWKRKTVPVTVWRPIAARVAAAHAITVNQLLWHGALKTGDQAYHQARRSFWRAIRELGYSLRQIGAISGHNHNAVVHGLRKTRPTPAANQETHPCL